MKRVFKQSPKTYGDYIKGLESQKYWVGLVNNTTAALGSVATTVYLSSIPGVGSLGSIAAGAAVGAVSKTFGNKLTTGFDEKIAELEALKANSDKAGIYIAESKVGEYVNISEVNKFGMERLYNPITGQYETHKADGEDLKIVTNEFTKSRYVEQRTDANGSLYYLESDKMYEMPYSYEQLVKEEAGEVGGVKSYSRNFVQPRDPEEVSIKRINREFLEEHGENLTKALKLNLSAQTREDYIKEQMKGFQPSRLTYLWGDAKQQKLQEEKNHGKEYDKLKDITNSYHSTIAAINPMERVEVHSEDDEYYFMPPKGEFKAGYVGWSFENSVIENLDNLVDNIEEEDVFVDPEEYIPA